MILDTLRKGAGRTVRHDPDGHARRQLRRLGNCRHFPGVWQPDPDQGWRYRDHASGIFARATRRAPRDELGRRPHPLGAGGPRGRAREPRAGAPDRRRRGRYPCQEPAPWRQRRGAAARHHEGSGLSGLDRQFQSARPAAGAAHSRHERAGLSRLRARAQSAAPIAEHGRQDAGRLPGVPQRAQQLQQ